MGSVVGSRKTFVCFIKMKMTGANWYASGDSVERKVLIITKERGILKGKNPLERHTTKSLTQISILR